MTEVLPNLLKANVSEETIEELERRLAELKKQRIREAKELGIAEKARLVAVELGAEFPKSHGSWWVFPPIQEFPPRVSDHEFLIAYDDYGNNLEVFYGGRKVLDVHLGDITLYVPGPWIRELINHYEAAKIKRARRELGFKIRALEEEAARWGVRLEDLISTDPEDEAPF